MHGLGNFRLDSLLESLWIHSHPFLVAHAICGNVLIEQTLISIAFYLEQVAYPAQGVLLLSLAFALTTEFAEHFLSETV